MFKSQSSLDTVGLLAMGQCKIALGISLGRKSTLSPFSKYLYFMTLLWSCFILKLFATS